MVALQLAVLIAGPPAAAAAALSPEVAEAQRHYNLAVTLYGENDLAGARAEFEHAYQLVPRYKILYNLGQVLYQLHDYAAALRAFRGYLESGDANIPEPRRSEVDGEIRRLGDRVGQLDLRGLKPDTVVRIDDVVIGHGPFNDPVTANVGQRKIEVVSAAGVSSLAIVELAAGQIVVVDLPPPARQLALRRPPRSDDDDASESPALLLRDAPTTRSRPRAAARGPVWLAWTATGALVAGAAVTGGFAYAWSRQVARDLNAFPSDAKQLARDRQGERGFALASDALLVGAVAVTALSLYFTLRN